MVAARIREVLVLVVLVTSGVVTLVTMILIEIGSYSKKMSYVIHFIFF